MNPFVNVSYTHDIYIYVCSYVCVRACTYMYRSYLCRFRRRSPTYTYTLGAQSGPAFRPSSATTEERCVPTREKWVQPTDTVEGRARGGREGRKVGGMGGKDATCFCPMRCAEHDCVSLYWTNLGLLGGTRCSNPLFLPSSPSYLPSSFFSFLLTYVFPFYCRSINRFYFSSRALSFVLLFFWLLRIESGLYMKTLIVVIVLLYPAEGIF